MNTDAYTRTALSVSELNREAKVLLEGHFDRVTVEGEIGNFTAASSGHWYFSLKDADAQVRCAMFRGANGRVKVRPSQGDSVRIRAKVSLYEGRGEFQLICEHLEPAGAGALQLAFERLKKQLSEEGLFSPTAKQPVPNDAAHVGVVTSATGAALQDVLTVLARRSPHTRIYVFPVPVQGEGAAEQIAAAIAQADRLTQSGALPLDVVIVGRGGGSLEDLWAFNEEAVARALYAATVPTVSAVGHEIDFSIADLVADTRAATPSAAAELVSTDQNEVAQHLDMLTVDLSRSMSRRLSDLNHQWSALKARSPPRACAQATASRACAAQFIAISRNTQTAQGISVSGGAAWLTSQCATSQAATEPATRSVPTIDASVAAAYPSAPAGHAWGAQSSHQAARVTGPGANPPQRLCHRHR